MHTILLPNGTSSGRFATKLEAVAELRRGDYPGGRAIYVPDPPEGKGLDMIHTITVKNHSCLHEIDVAQMVRAIRHQVQNDFCPQYGLRNVDICYAPPKINPTTGPKRAVLLLVDDDCADPDALGYHTESGDGTIYALVVVRAILEADGVPLLDPKRPERLTVSSVVSHEILEMIADPYVNRWVDSPLGNSWSFEVCDPVEATQYRITGGTPKYDAMVSNFVLPCFWNPDAKTRCDWLGTVMSPFTLASGGYAVVRDGAPGTEKEIFGEVVGEGRACLPWRRTKQIVAGRSVLRLRENWIEPPDQVLSDVDEVLLHPEKPLEDPELGSLDEPITKVEGIKRVPSDRPETD